MILELHTIPYAHLYLMIAKKLVNSVKTKLYHVQQNQKNGGLFLRNFNQERTSVHILVARYMTVLMTPLPSLYISHQELFQFLSACSYNENFRYKWETFSC